MLENDQIILKIGKGLFGAFTVTVMKDGKRLSPFSANIPTSLRELMQKSLRQGNVEAFLVTYLKQDNPTHPIEVGLGLSAKKTHWDPEYKEHPIVVIDTTTRPFKVISSGKNGDEIEKIGQTLVLNTRTLQLGCWDETIVFSGDEDSLNEVFEIEPSSLNHSPIPIYEIETSPIQARYHENEGIEKISAQPATQLVLRAEKDAIGDVILSLWSGVDGFLCRCDTEMMPTLQKQYHKARKKEGATAQDILERLQFETPLPKGSLTLMGNRLGIIEMPEGIVACWIEILECFKEKIEWASRQSHPQLHESIFLDQASALKKVMEKYKGEVELNTKEIRLVDYDIEVRFNENDMHAMPDVYIDGVLRSVESLSSLSLTGWLKETENSLETLSSESKLKIQALLTLVEHEDSTKNAKKIPSYATLRILDWASLIQYGVKVELPAAEKEIIEKLLALNGIEDTPLPDSLTGTPREYQRGGYNWISFLYRHHLGAVLADDMGLGKTIQAIMVLAGISEKKIKSRISENMPSLIVVPPSLMYNWESELKKWIPNSQIYLYKGTDRLLPNESIDIMIATYEGIRRDIEQLKEIQFHLIIFDEAQVIKNALTGRSQAAMQLKGAFRLCLTGTPMENHLREYLTILELALPGLFGAVKPDQIENEGVMRWVMRRAKPFVLRRLKEAVAPQLPEKQEQNIALNMSASQEAYYNQVVRQIRKEMKTAYQNKSVQQAGIMALTALLRLRQICISPQLVDPSYTEVSPKLKVLVRRAAQVIEEGHSALIFSQFTSCLDLIEPLLNEEKITWLRLDGKTSIKKRGQLVEEFQNSAEPKIFLMSLKAGGVGLNLTKASYVFHVDPWWNPAVEAQATDRTHRIGQEKHVFVDRLIMHETVEEKMMVLKAKKQELFNKIVEHQGEAASVSLTKEDFDFLLGVE